MNWLFWKIRWKWGDDMNLDLAMKTYQSIRKSEEMSEKQIKQVIRFAYNSGDKELTSQYISDLIRGEIPDEEIKKDYEELTDDMPKWAEDFGELILTMAMCSLEHEEAIKELNERLEEILWQTKSQKQSR